MELTCSRCKTDKPKSEFNKLSSSNRGYQRYCRVCARAYEKVWRINNKDKTAVIAKKHRQKASEYVRQIKDNAQCMDCKVRYPYYVMDFDHLRDKRFSLAHRKDNHISRIKEEIAKCELVCANCHRIRTWKRKQ